MMDTFLKNIIELIDYFLEGKSDNIILQKIVKLLRYKEGKIISYKELIQKLNKEEIEHINKSFQHFLPVSLKNLPTMQYKNGIILPFRKEGKDFLAFILFGKGETNEYQINLVLQLLKLYNEIYGFKGIEEKLRKVERQYKSILMGVSDLILALNKRGKITFVNSWEVLETFLEKEKSEIMNKPIYKVLNLSKNEFRKARRIVFNAIREKANRIDDLELSTIIGKKKKWFSINATFDKEGENYKGAKIIIRDITEKKKKEEEILLLKDRLLRILTHLPFGTIILDDNFKVVSSHLESTGFRNWIKELEELFPIEEEVRLLKQYLLELTNFEFEAKALNENSELIPVKLICSKINDKENWRYLIAIEDLRDKKRLQEQIIGQENLVLLGELSAGISHEIGNIISIIKANARYSLKKHDIEGYKEAMQIIYEQSHRGIEFIKKLKQLARAEESIRSEIKIKPIIEEILMLFKSSFEKNNIEVKIDIEDEGITILADKNQIQTVLINLIINAIQAIEPKGKGEIKIRAYKKSYYTAMIIEDTGIGIPKRLLSKIFQPFFTTKKQGEGSGMGLSICNMIIENHNGYIYADSEEGEGSKFFIYLPRTKDLV